MATAIFQTATPCCPVICKTELGFHFILLTYVCFVKSLAGLQFRMDCEGKIGLLDATSC